MNFLYNPISFASHILMENANDMRELSKVRAILEDSESPITNKYLEKLYDSVISKGHVQFGDIALSKGDIVQYKGYTNMIQVLENMQQLASSNKAQDVLSYVDTIKTSIRYMINLKDLYRKAFMTNNQMVMLEYNTYVYTIVQATSALLYEYVDFLKRPSEKSLTITLKNNKYRANLFYFEQLNKFVNINKNMDYKNYLTALLNNGKENFTGAEVVGLFVVVSVALAIIPLTRELVYRFYDIRADIADCMAQQAYFLDLNKACIEANSDFSAQQKQNILIKQEKAKNLCLKISEKLRVTHAKSIDKGKAALVNDNKLLTIDNMKEEISSDSSPLQLL